MRILAIESSCDETAAAVVEDGRTVLSSVVASQIETHQRYGGVVPELASREHLRAITPVVEEALTRSGTTWKDLGAVACTYGPGLLGSLLVGVTYAKAISLAQNLPLIAVNHLEGHIHAVVLEHPQTALPALALIVSGGHTHLYHVRANFKYELISKTRDDAAGEAYDKVAKLLGYPYPGGPILDKLAPHGNPRGVPFTKPRMNSGNPLDFSFSGMKTAVLRWTEANPVADEIAARKRVTPTATLEEWLVATPAATLDLIASFQHAVIDELLSRIGKLTEEHPVESVIITGGVACNAGLRQAAAASSMGVPIYFPTPGLSTDNAAMIGAAAFRKLQAGDIAGLDLRARASLPL